MRITKKKRNPFRVNQTGTSLGGGVRSAGLPVGARPIRRAPRGAMLRRRRCQWLKVKVLGARQVDGDLAGLRAYATGDGGGKGMGVSAVCRVQSLHCTYI